MVKSCINLMVGSSVAEKFVSATATQYSNKALSTLQTHCFWHSYIQHVFVLRYRGTLDI